MSGNSIEFEMTLSAMPKIEAAELDLGIEAANGGSSAFPYSSAANFPYSTAANFPYSSAANFPYSSATSFPYSSATKFPYSSASQAVSRFPYSSCAGGARVLFAIEG
jgi:hypothetical protein